MSLAAIPFIAIWKNEPNCRIGIKKSTDNKIIKTHPNKYPTPGAFKVQSSTHIDINLQQINQIIKSQNDSKKTWELSDEEKERANDYDSRDEDIITVTLEEDYEK